MSVNQQPLHVEVRDGLLHLIRERGLRPGDQVPTEAEVSREFGVGRSTSREALRLLEQDGVITVERGRGRFVAAGGFLRVERPIDRFESVTEMLEALGYEPTSVVLSVQEAPADADEAVALELAEGDPVIRLVRLRASGDRPLIFSINTVPRDCLPGPIEHRDWTGSLTAALAAHGHRVDSSTARLQAADLPADAERRFSLAGLGPWLLIDETCFSRAGRKVLHARDYHRGPDIAFNVVRRR